MGEKRVVGASTGAPTDVFFAGGAASAGASSAPEAPDKPGEPVPASGNTIPVPGDTSLYTVDGKAYRGVGYRTLKKRLARLASSQLVLILGLFLSVSAALTAFRGYLLPVTVFLAAERAVFALGLWRVYFTAGKKGGAFLAAMSFWTPFAAVAGLLFFAVFLACSMFGKLLLFRGEAAEELVRLVYRAKLWAVLPALLCVAAAYWVYLFARRQRLLLCNMRDGLRYGFPFENGYRQFSRNCVFVAVLMSAFQVLRAFFHSFGGIGAPAQASAMLDRLLLSQRNYTVNALGVAVQAAVFILAAALARRYGKTVRKYKAQRQSYDEERRSAEKGAAEVLALEKEKVLGKSR